MKPKTFLWGFMFALALIILRVDLSFLSRTHPLFVHFYTMRSALLPHAVFGIISILTGPVQFSSRVRREYPKFHRVLGRVYVWSVLISAPLGALITYLFQPDGYLQAGVYAHSGVWFVTTLMAFLTARNRQIVQHRQWMIRSYLLTFSFIIARIVSPLWPAFGLAYRDNGIIDVILNLCYVLGADIALNWREITTKRA